MCSILLANGETLSWQDLSTGTNINIYNRVYRVHACDAFTRRFMDAQGRPQVLDAIDTRPYYRRFCNPLQAGCANALAMICRTMC